MAPALFASNIHYAGVGNKPVEPPPFAPYRPEEGHLGVIVLHVAFNEERSVAFWVQLCRERFSFLDAPPGNGNIVSPRVEALGEIAADAVLRLLSVYEE
jgi:hypothetical protein